LPGCLCFVRSLGVKDGVLFLPINMADVGAESTTVRREPTSPADELPS
jgi:hypothetical protein